MVGCVVAIVCGLIILSFVIMVFVGFLMAANASDYDWTMDTTFTWVARTTRDYWTSRNWDQTTREYSRSTQGTHNYSKATTERAYETTWWITNTTTTQTTTTIERTTATTEKWTTTELATTSWTTTTTTTMATALTTSWTTTPTTSPDNGPVGPEFDPTTTEDPCKCEFPYTFDVPGQGYVTITYCRYIPELWPGKNICGYNDFGQSTIMECHAGCPGFG